MSISQLPLPNSLDEPYHNSYVEIEKKLKSVTTVESFVQCLCGLVNDQEMEGLKPWHDKLAASYQSIVGHCLALPELFPHGTLPFLAPGSDQTISLSLAQSRCLNAHRFIGSFRTLEQHRTKWPLNLTHWLLKRPSRFPEGQAYLECLLDYFADHPPGSTDEKTRAVTFTRCVLTDKDAPKWEMSDAIISAAEVIDDGTGIGDVPGEVLTDFANEDIGPSVAATQEEIIFGFFPELQPAVLFAGRMEDNEAIVMRGAKRAGKSCGYGDSLRYLGRCSSEEHEATILAIDASISRYGVNGRLQQLRPDAMARELNKAFVGFRGVAQSAHEPAILATGKWGCGVFGGDMDIKHTVQSMACAALGGCLRLKFYCIENDAFSQRLRQAQPHLDGKSVREVYQALEQYAKYVEHAQGQAVPFYSFLAEPRRAWREIT